jgi:CBS domain-containing protein
MTQIRTLPVKETVLRGGIVLIYNRVTLSQFLANMDVSGNISAILNQKGREIFSVSPDASVYDAVSLLAEKNVGAVLVMDGEKLVGLLSERDYTRKVMLRGKRSRDTIVSEIMSTDLKVVNPRESVEDCLRLMTDKRIRHLPVLDGDKVVGVISIGDLVKWVISCQSAAIAHLENYIQGGFGA